MDVESTVEEEIRKAELLLARDLDQIKSGVSLKVVGKSTEASNIMNDERRQKVLSNLRDEGVLSQSYVPITTEMLLKNDQ